MKNYKKLLAEYILALMVTGMVILWIFKLWNFNIHIPLTYTWDGLHFGSLIKSIIDNGWFLKNNYLGTPFGQETYDFLQTDFLHFFIIKIFSLFSNEYSVILNLFYLSSFFLTTITSLYTLRSIGLTYFPSLLSSILYSILPYHFLRFNVGHVLLSTYYIIPLIFLLVLWIYEEENCVFFNNKLTYKASFINKRAIYSVLLCLLISSSGTYYAFFTCVLLGVVSLTFLSSKNYKKILDVVVLLASVIIGFIANLMPAIIYHFSNGKNPIAAVRNPIEAEYYGLKITQFFIPVWDFSLKSIKNIVDTYSTYPLNNEGSEYLGFFGAIGFLYLIYNLIILKRSTENNLIKKLSILNISMVMMGTIGGFGSIFALVISAQIRAYNRISIFIAFLSLIAFALLIDKLLKRKSYYMKVVISIFLLLALFAGMIDQTGNRKLAPDTKGIATEYSNDQEFVSQIEATVPTESKIFQLPYVPFPENPPVHKMNDYELLKGYLHSENLYWSYGSMKGRSQDDWLKLTSGKPYEEMIESLSFAGFNGIYIDRFGFEDNGIKIEGEMRRILQEDPIVSRNERLIFFSMSKYNSVNRTRYTDIEWKENINRIMNPLIVEWGDGFYDLETSSGNYWRWSSKNGELTLNNSSSSNKSVELDMTIATGELNDSDLSLSGEIINEKIRVNSTGVKVRKKIIIPPGKHLINFESNAQRVDSKQDSRILVFRVIDLQINE